MSLLPIHVREQTERGVMIIKRFRGETGPLKCFHFIFAVSRTFVCRENGFVLCGTRRNSAWSSECFNKNDRRLLFI